jgi:hypothetical protein
MVKEMSLVV